MFSLIFRRGDGLTLGSQSCFLGSQKGGEGNAMSVSIPPSKNALLSSVETLTLSVELTLYSGVLVDAFCLPRDASTLAVSVLSVSCFAEIS